ncbi:MAG: glycosyltransferase, partial [Thermoanaerobaculia bacterium]
AQANHDVLLFQIGNDPLHLASLETLKNPARTTPAVVVLHDFSLHHLFAAAYIDRGRMRDYAQELERAHGARGRALALRALAGPPIPVWDLDPWSFPMSAGVIRDAAAVIVHSRLVRGAVLREVPSCHVTEIPHHVVVAPRTERRLAREKLRLPQDRPLAVSLGVVTPAKRIARVLEALALIEPSLRPFFFVGGALASDDPLHAMIERFGLEADVSFGGYLSDADFWLAASAGDFAVNLRHPTVGETSGAVCRLAGFGLPLLVSDVGWFRELPDSFAAKIPVGSGEVERIAEELLRLSSDAPERSRRSSAAAEWGAERSPDRIARLYARVLNEVADGAAGPLGLSGVVAAQLHALGIARGRTAAASRLPDAEVLSAVARAASGILPVRPETAGTLAVRPETAGTLAVRPETAGILAVRPDTDR